jgi:hypothetical protein
VSSNILKTVVRPGGYSSQTASGMWSDPARSSDVVEDLGEQLRAFYSHLMSEPVPNRLVRLLEHLSRREGLRRGA